MSAIMSILSAIVNVQELRPRTCRPLSTAQRRRTMFEDNDDTTIYKVVLNHEEQYSIWPVDRENPAGWRDAGKSGTKAECLAYIKEVWTDMRPLSLRKQMDGKE